MASNINLWFAKDENGEIVTVNDVNKEYEGKYYCPLCGSEVIPKALDSNMVSPHFAHINREACSGESIVHYWVKNQLIKVDDVFEVITDEPHQYMCKEILMEQSYETPHGLYRPDATIITYKGEKIFVEINYTNKKKVNDYYFKWKHLDNIVIEFSIRNVYDEENNKINITNSFKALYFDGMPINKNDGEYITYRRSISSKHNKFADKINEIEWFIDDLYKYNIGINSDLDELVNSFLFLAKDESNLPILEVLYKNNRCQDTIKEIIRYRDNFTMGLKSVVGVENIMFEINGSNRLVVDRVKNNKLHKRVSFRVEETAFKILSKFLDDYKYFLDSFLKDKNSIESIKYHKSLQPVDWRYFIDVQIKSIIDDICNNDKYIKEMATFEIRDMISHANNLIKLKDYIITGNEDFYRMFKELFSSSNDNALSILMINNEDYFYNTIEFIKSNKEKIRYNKCIEEVVGKIDFNSFIYVNNDLKLLNINKVSTTIISIFEKEYSIFEKEFQTCIDSGMTYVGSGGDNWEFYFKYFLKRNNLPSELLSLLNKEGFFPNYDGYKERVDWKIEDTILDIIIEKIGKEKEKYMKNINREILINLNILSYFKLIYNNDTIIRLSERYEMLYKLQTTFINILTIADMNIRMKIVYYGGLNDEFEFIMKTQFGEIDYDIKINNDMIMVNNIQMIKITNTTSPDEIISKFKFVVDVITKNNKSYLEDEIIDIYERLINIYKRRTYNNYNIEVDYDLSGIQTLTISRLGVEMASCRVNKNTKFEEVINIFSDGVRKYLYGGK